MFRHFINFKEANAWLDFDCTPAEARKACHSNPDRYYEWANWANRWDAKGYSDIDGPEGRLSS
jgi:hypothetical protein